MKLPDAELAVVPRAKVTDYLLSETHPPGRAKARVFVACGFDRAEPELFEEALVTVARTGNVIDVQPTPYGTKYVVEGDLGGSVAASLTVRTVWIIEKTGDAPRLVTAYPI